MRISTEKKIWITILRERRHNKEKRWDDTYWATWRKYGRWGSTTASWVTRKDQLQLRCRSSGLHPRHSHGFHATCGDSIPLCRPRPECIVSPMTMCKRSIEKQISFKGLRVKTYSCTRQLREAEYDRKEARDDRHFVLWYVLLADVPVLNDSLSLAKALIWLVELKT